MKIDKHFLEQLTGSLSKDKIERESKKFGNIFSIINKLYPHDNKIDVEEITKFAVSIWQEDDGDGKISNDEIESYIQKNKLDFENTGIKAKDIKKFLEFFIKNSDKTPNDIRIDNGDGTYSIITQREEFEEQRIVTNKKEIDEWNEKYNSGANDGIFGIFKNNIKQNQNNISSDKNTNNDSRDFLSKNTAKVENKKQDNIGFLTNKSVEPKLDKQPEPVYEKRFVSKGVVSRKINYNSKNQIISIEETIGNLTTITDSNGKLLRTITKGEGVKDTIKDYTILDDGIKEESIFYGENGAKESSNPTYKNVYKDNKLVAKYEYDSNGQIIQRQNIKEGVVVSVTKYNSGVEAATIQLFTNTNTYATPDKAFDKMIDPIKQNLTGNCWLLDGLSKFSKKNWGRQAISDAISIDAATGNIIVKFKRAYGDTKEFVITQQELAQAKQETTKYYSFALEQGDVIYIDGKRELRMSQNNSFVLQADYIKDNITFVDKSGKECVWTIEDLKNGVKGQIEGPKYSSGDLTVLAIELAVEKSRREVGLPLDGGVYEEVLAMFTDIDSTQYFCNSDLDEGFLNTTEKTNSEKDIMKLWEQQKGKLTQHIKHNEKSVNSQAMLEEITKIMQNPERYSCELGLKMDGICHAGQIIRFEQKDGKDYIVYSHSWDEKAEITEELEDFVKTKLLDLVVVEKKIHEEINIAYDSRIGSFEMGNKLDRTNFVSAIAMLGQNPNFKPEIQKDGDNFVVTIKGEKIIIIPSELETARVSGAYSTKDDDVSLLEIAVERYINKTRHNNTMYELSHTNIEDVKIQDILNLFSDKEFKPQQSRSLAEASKKDGLKFAVKRSFDNVNSFYAIKEIKQAPDGKYLISVVQPEDTSVAITYTEDEYRKIFNIIEIYS